MNRPSFLVSGFHDAYHAPVWDALFARHPDADVEAVLADVIPRVPSTARLRAHRFYDLALRADWGVPPSSLRPLDATTVEAYADVETTFLRMADRLELVGPTSYSQRKTLYLRHLQYISHVLDTRQVTAAIFSNVPHEMYDYVMYEACRRRGIPTLGFLQTQVEDTFISFEDWRDPMPGADTEVTARLAERGQDAVGRLDGRFRTHFERQVAPQGDVLPFYMRGPAERSTLGKLRAAFTEAGPPRAWPNAAYSRVQKWSADRATAQLAARYDALTRAPDLSVPYIYVALHYQPEMTTCPSAGAFVDQRLILELLAATAGAHGLRVYVKEHPKQIAAGRDPREYTAWASLPGVTLLPRHTDNYRLIEGARAVATCTGTPGWEALFRRTPVLMFGRYFYQYAPGVHRIRGRADLEAALDAIVAGRGVPSAESTACFLGVLSERAHEGYVDGLYRAVSSVDEGRAGAAVAHVLTRWLEERLPR